MLDVIQLLCDLWEAPNEVFCVGAMGPECDDSLRILTELGALCAGPRPESITCLACDRDHSAVIEFDAQKKRYMHFCPQAGWVAVGNTDLATLCFNPEWVVDWLVGALSVTKFARSRALVPGRVWRLGDAPCGNAMVTIVFARRISSQAALDQLASVLGNIHHADKGLVITTSPQVARQVKLPHGFAFSDVREISRMVGRQPQVDQTTLASLVQGLPGRSRIASRAIQPVRKNPRAPDRLDYRQVDRQLVDEMRDMIMAGKASGPTDAARALARRAVGSKKEASKVTRLVKRYKELHQSN